MPRCQKRVWGDRGASSKCQNSAGYGPDKAYCKIHARQKGEVFGEIVILYRARYKDWTGPMRIAEIQAEETAKTYRLSGNDRDFDYANRLSKEDCPNLGIFTTKEEALSFFVKDTQQVADAAHKRAVDAARLALDAAAFAQENGLETP